MKRILVILGHPNKDSYCEALANAYAEGAKQKGHDIKMLPLHALKFDLNLSAGYQQTQALEPDLLMAQEKINWANHIVIIHPVWWGSVPALLKGFTDRVLLPSYAFKYRKDSPMWDKLLTGKSGRIIYTLDYPIWYYRFVLGAPAEKQLKKMTMEFCGIKPVQVNRFGPIRNSKPEQRSQWLSSALEIGRSES